MWKRQRKLSEWVSLGASCAVRCDHCGHTGKISGKVLLAAFWPGVTIKEVRQKLRCSECGKRGAKIAPIPGAP